MSEPPGELAMLGHSMSQEQLQHLIDSAQGGGGEQTWNPMAFTPHYSAMARRPSQPPPVPLRPAGGDVGSGLADLLPADLSDSLSAIVRKSPAAIRRQLSLAKAAIGDGAASAMRVPPPHSASFSQVAYLGCGRIENPKSEEEIQRLLCLLNAEKRTAADFISVTLSLPAAWDGELRLCDSDEGAEVAAFRLHRILFCARGRLSSPEADCFAFTYAQTLLPPPTDVDAAHKLGYQLHAFRCLVPEAVGKVLLCFAAAFRRLAPEPSPPQLPCAALSRADGAEMDFQFEAFLEIKEEDGKGGWPMSPQEKNCFKLRRAREKRIVVVLQQVSGPKVLIVGKCFGLLLAAGRNVRQSDMHLLDMQSMGRGQTESVYVIEALWNPNSPQFEVLNTETPRADVVLSGIHDPVRFSIEAKVRIFHQHERFWYITRRPVVERYFMTVKKARTLS